MAQKINDVDTSKPEANFTFEVNDVKNLLNSINFRGSEFFYCRSMRFFLDMKKEDKIGPSYLSAYLNREKPSDDYYYSMKTNFDLRLVNWLGKEDLVKTFNYCFARETKQGFGTEELIKIDELINPLNGWVQNDTLRLRVNLKCEPFYRSSG